MGVIATPHLGWPVARGRDGKLVKVEQGTTEHVMACENVVVRCPVGFREDRPEFGWPFPTFRGIPLDTGALEAALKLWVPPSNASVSEYLDVLTGRDHLVAESRLEDDQSG